MRICDVEGCGRKHSGNGLCKNHYNDWYRNTEKGKAAQRKFKESNKYKPNDPKYIKQRRINTARWYTTEKGKAYGKIISLASCKYRNMKLKCLIPNCEKTDIHKHHEDYSKPYDIIPLCSFHHRELHRGNLDIETSLQII